MGVDKNFELEPDKLSLLQSSPVGKALLSIAPNGERSLSKIFSFSGINEKLINAGIQSLESVRGQSTEKVEQALRDMENIIKIWVFGDIGFGLRISDSGRSDASMSEFYKFLHVFIPILKSDLLVRAFSGNVETSNDSVNTAVSVVTDSVSSEVEEIV